MLRHMGMYFDHGTMMAKIGDAIRARSIDYGKITGRDIAEEHKRRKHLKIRLLNGTRLDMCLMRLCYLRCKR